MKILLVEDDLEVAAFLVRGLKYEGYKVDHLTDGSNVYQRLSQNHYELLILDLILAEGSGEQILIDMRLQKITVPVIVLSAVNDITTKTRLLNHGADDYLIKPFSFVELVARIKSVLRRSQGTVRQVPELKVGDLTLDPVLRVVTRGGKKIRLRLKEYALLEYLMQNPDQVVTRNTLIENVWDYNAKLFSNTVDSHISLLRKKIDGGYENKLIETIHGVGYILRSKVT